MEKEKKNKKMHRRYRTVLRVAETILELMALGFAVQLLVLREDLSVDVILLAVFLLNACACILSAFNAGRAKKLRFTKYIVLGCTYFINAVLLYFFGSSGGIIIVFLIYAASMIFGRVISMIKNHRVMNIVFNIIAIIFWTLVALGVALAPLVEMNDNMALMVLAITIPFQMIIRVTQTSFAHIRYDILTKVIRKSMAVEILTGLVILIVAISLVLPLIEPQIDSYSDALWYCFAIVTTIGFGDISAVTGLGRILSVILGIYGIVVVSLITSVIVNFYNEINREDDAKRNPAEPVLAEAHPAAEEKPLSGPSDADAGGQSDTAHEEDK